MSDNTKRDPLLEKLEQLERSHRVSESHRRNCLSILEQACEGRDYWEQESCRLLGEIERLKDQIDRETLQICTICDRVGCVGRCCGRDTHRDATDQEVQEAKEKTCCVRCDIARECEFAFDLYNVGCEPKIDCLAAK